MRYNLKFIHILIDINQFPKTRGRKRASCRNVVWTDFLYSFTSGSIPRGTDYEGGMGMDTNDRRMDRENWRGVKGALACAESATQSEFVAIGVARSEKKKREREREKEKKRWIDIVSLLTFAENGEPRRVGLAIRGRNWCWRRESAILPWVIRLAARGETAHFTKRIGDRGSSLIHTRRAPQ